MLHDNIKKLSIVIIDDNDFDSTAMKKSLQERHLVNPIHDYKSAARALEALKNKEIPSPYFIILDLCMPEKDGIDFLRELRKDPDLSNSIVFVVTGSNKENDFAESHQFNIAGYINKSNVSNDFSELAFMFEDYWNVIELPVRKVS